MPPKMFGKFKKSSSPERTNSPSASLMDRRNQQVATLPHRATPQSSTHYILPLEGVQSPQGKPVTLHIHLPPSFPDTPPQLLVQPPIPHAWCNQEGYLGMPRELRDWNPDNNLGRIVRDIEREFKIRSVYQIPVQPASIPPPQSIPQPQPAPTPQQSAWPEVDSLSVDMLETLLSSPEALQAFYESLDAPKQIAQIHRELLKQSEELAQQNLSQAPVIEDLQSRLENVTGSIQVEAQKHAQLLAAYREEAERFSPQRILPLIENAIQESEKASDEISESFYKGQISVDEFLKQYKEERKRFHQRSSVKEIITSNPGIL
ncbi:hypothetical protein HDU85_002721 [Gaertneriomyces sp. JEL0708]|nr:hypothetical protein HDU85_002721 [Gaertneriomyces sp. JEL0708]